MRTEFGNGMRPSKQSESLLRERVQTGLLAHSFAPPLNFSQLLSLFHLSALRSEKQVPVPEDGIELESSSGIFKVSSHNSSGYFPVNGKNALSGLKLVFHAP